MNRALIVGVYRYRKGGYDRLKGPWSDVSAVRNALGQPRSVYASGRGEIDTLWNPDEDDLKAAITNLFESAKPNDHVLLYFSGQTDNVGDDDGKSGGISLTGRDSTVAGRDRSGLTTNDLRSLAKASDARSVQVILDGSRSGSSKLGDGDLVESSERLGTNKAFAVLAATNGESVSDASRLGELSAFTRSVVDELEGQRSVSPGADFDIEALAERLGPDHNASGLVSSRLHIEGDPGPILQPVAAARSAGFTPAERSRGALASTLIALGVLALAFALPRMTGDGPTSVATNSDVAAETSTDVAGATVARSPSTTLATSTTLTPPTTVPRVTSTSAPKPLSTIAPSDISNATETSSGASSSPLTTPPTSAARGSAPATLPPVTTTEARRTPVRPDISTTTTRPRTTSTVAPSTTQRPFITVPPSTTSSSSTTSSPAATSTTQAGGEPIMPSNMAVQGQFSPDPKLSSDRFTFERRSVTSIGSSIQGIRFTDTNNGEAFYRVRVRDYTLQGGLRSCPGVDGFKVLTCIIDGDSGQRTAARLSNTVEADLAGINGVGQTHTRTIPDLRGRGDNDVVGGSGTMHCVDMRSIYEVEDGRTYSNWTKPECFLGGPSR